MKHQSAIVSKEEIIRIRGAYTAKYGIIPDDSLTCLLCELAEISTKIDKSVQPYQINRFWVAFAFGFGKFGMALIMVLSIILLFMYRNYYGSLEQKEKFEQVNQTLHMYHNIADFEDFIKDSKRVTNPAGLPMGMYLTFKISKNVKNGFGASTQGILKPDSLVFVPLYFRSKYGHLSIIFVKLNEKVSIGQIIGLMGNSGMVTGKHLHYCLIKNGFYLNPVLVMYLFLKVKTQKNNDK